LRQQGATNKSSSPLLLSTTYPADRTQMNDRIYFQLLQIASTTVPGWTFSKCPAERKAVDVSCNQKQTMKLISTLILTFLLKTSFGQIADNTDSHNDRNIYLQALKHYLDFRATDASYSKLKKIDTIYVYRDTKTTDSLLDSIGSTKIITIEDPYTFIKEQKLGGLTLYSIFPLDYEKGEFWVSFVPFSVTIDKKRKQGLLFSNPGSYKIVFKFDNGHFVFIRIEDHGI
jgi:hypothetical protein